MSSVKVGIFRRKYFGRKTSLILTSIVIGLLSAFAAVLLKNSVGLIQEWVHEVSIRQRLHYLLFIFPTAGILLTVIYVQLFRKGNLGRGIGNILYCISRKSGFIPRDKLYSQLLSSILTVGFGGSAGLEAPIASTGSAIGSNMARWLRFTYKERLLLLACGAAAGISAIFNAPIAGVVFAFEILLVDMPISVIIPLLISSASASLLSRLIYSGQPFVLITDSWHSYHLIHYIVLGIIAAFVSVYANRVYFFIDDVFTGKKMPYLKAIVGGLMLGGLIFLFPPLYGEGYESVLSLLHGQPNALMADSFVISPGGSWHIVIFAAAIMLLKVTATSITVGAGGNGGMFGSSLFTGAMCGFVFARTANLLGLGSLNEINFTVIGMAAMLSGIIHAPLTAIFLIAEITGGYALFVPLMIVSSITYLVTRYFEPYSVYTKKLAEKGDLPVPDKDKFVLGKMHLRYYLERDFLVVKATDPLSILIQGIKQSKRNVFPVIDDNGIFLGVIRLDDVRHVMFSTEMYETTILKDLMKTSPVIDIHESMEEVLRKFEDFDLWNIPVTDKSKYVGFVSKSKILTHYREHLIKEADIPG